jgi:hypothetical protein
LSLDLASGEQFTQLCTAFKSEENSEGDHESTNVAQQSTFPDTPRNGYNSNNSNMRRLATQPTVQSNDEVSFLIQI